MGFSLTKTDQQLAVPQFVENHPYLFRPIYYITLYHVYIYIYTQITHMVSIHVVYIYISNVYINVGVYNIRYTKLYLYIYKYD